MLFLKLKLELGASTKVCPEKLLLKTGGSSEGDKSDKDDKQMWENSCSVTIDEKWMCSNRYLVFVPTFLNVLQVYFVKFEQKKKTVKLEVFCFFCFFFAFRQVLKLFWRRNFFPRRI